ncbi:MAG: VOC family protein, partial [bacterium]
MSVKVKLDHFGLYVKDMVQTIRWYHDIFGFRLSDYLPPGNTEEPAAPHGIAWLRYGDLHHDLTIVQYPPEAMADHRPRRADNLQQLAYHLAAEEEVEAAYGAVVSAGVSIIRPLGRGPLLGIL